MIFDWNINSCICCVCQELLLDKLFELDYYVYGDCMGKDINLNNILNQALLFDFYGELLTEHQKRIYEEVILNDYSISEVAREEGTSRQSVSELIKRCDKILNEYEDKLGLVKKFHKTKLLVGKIKELTFRFFKDKDEKWIKEIERLSTEIVDETF